MCGSYGLVFEKGCTYDGCFFEYPSTEGQKSTFFRLRITERASMYGARIKTIQTLASVPQGVRVGGGTPYFRYLYSCRGQLYMHGDLVL